MVMGMLTRVRARSAWFGRVVSLPGTVDDIKVWWGILRAFVLPTLLVARGWAVDNFVEGLYYVGAVAVSGWGVAETVQGIRRIYRRRHPKVVVAEADPIRAVGCLGEATGRASPATYRQLRDVGLSRCKCVVVMARQRAKRLRGGYGGHK